MKKSKVLNIFIASMTVMCMLFTTAYAAFPDVPSTKYNWAVDAINSMADEGIIKGYEDGSFKPEKSITKLEGLVLVARVLGSGNSENEAFISEAMHLYEDTINKYDINFGKEEVAYLLLKGVIKEADLNGYIGSGKSGTSLMRYEIAVLLTKALDGELPASSTLTYADADKVPDSAKKYVRFVTDNGLMNGMEGNKFSPNTGVTRAQAAVVLKKLLDKTDYEFKTGNVVEINTTMGVLKIKESNGNILSHTILPDVILRQGGEIVTKAEIKAGYVASVTYKDDEVYAIDFISSLADSYVYGALKSIVNTSKTAIGVAIIEENETEPSDETTVYNLSDDVVVTLNDEAASLGKLDIGSYVKLNIKSGKVKTIEAYDKQTTASGTISAISYAPSFKIEVSDKSGNIKEYQFMNNAIIMKNNKSITAAELEIGDTVTVTLEYDRIKKITAISKSTTKSGVITEILISSSPKLTLTIDGEDVTYPLSISADYSITGKDGQGSIYDLRTNTVATVTFASDTIVKVVTSSVVESTAITGEVISATPAAKVFQIRHVDIATGVVQTDTVVVNTKTTIMDTKGKDKTFSVIKEGAKVTVYGSIGSGVVAAETVMIID